MSEQGVKVRLQDGHYRWVPDADGFCAERDLLVVMRGDSEIAAYRDWVEVEVVK